MQAFRTILSFFLSWRLLLFLPIIVGYLFIPYRAGYDYTNLWKFTKPYAPVDSFLLYPWANFDGVHYLSIAAQGYNHDEGFFPLFPIVIRAIATLFGGGEPFSASYFFAGIAIANVAFFGSLFFLHKLLRIDYKETVAKKSILFLLLFPTSFFFASIYSESIFLFLALATFYFARKKRWLWAGIFGMLLTGTRIVGISILPALAIELYLQEKKLLTRNVFFLLLIPLGLVSYMYYNVVTFGYAFAFLEAHTKLGTNRSDVIVLFPQTIVRYINILTTLPSSQFEWRIALLELYVFFFASALLFAAWKKKVRISYVVFAVVSFLIPISSGTFSGLPRYVLVLFPMFIALALVKSRIVHIAYITLGAVLLFILLMFFSRGYFVS